MKKEKKTRQDNPSLCMIQIYVSNILGFQQCIPSSAFPKSKIGHIKVSNIEKHAEHQMRRKL